MTFFQGFGPVQFPVGFRDAFAFRRILQDELELELGRLADEVLTDLRRETIPFSGVTRAAWRAEGPESLDGGNQFQITFVNDGPPRGTSGGIIANTFESGARPHFPPPSPRGDGRDLTDWIRKTIPTAFSEEKTLGMQERAINRAAFAIGRSIKRRGLPSGSNASRLGAFDRVFQRRRAEIENRVARSVSLAIARWAEEGG